MVKITFTLLYIYIYKCTVYNVSEYPEPLTIFGRTNFTTAIIHSTIMLVKPLLHVLSPAIHLAHKTTLSLIQLAKRYCTWRQDVIHRRCVPVIHNIQYIYLYYSLPFDGNNNTILIIIIIIILLIIFSDMQTPRSIFIKIWLLRIVFVRVRRWRGALPVVVAWIWCFFAWRATLQLQY